MENCLGKRMKIYKYETKKYQLKNLLLVNTIAFAIWSNLCMSY